MRFLLKFSQNSQIIAVGWGMVRSVISCVVIVFSSVAVASFSISLDKFHKFSPQRVRSSFASWCAIVLFFVFA